MKIAVWHNLPSGGGKRALFEHLRGLHARGHTLEIWRPTTVDDDFLPLSDFGRQHVLDLPWPPARRGRDRLMTFAEAELSAMAGHLRRCAEEMAGGGFDLLFANSCKFFRAPAIAQHSRLPSLLYLQEPYRWLYEAMPEFAWKAPGRGLELASFAGLRRTVADQRRIWGLRVQAREEYLSARAFDRILVNSLFSRESVLRAYGLTAEVCYLGADLDRFRDEGRPREGLVLGLGAVTREKGLELAIRAVARLDAPRPQLVWIGNFADPVERAEMEALARELGAPLDIRVNVSDAELCDWLNRATAMLYAPRLEPFGLAPIEAAGCGLPVVGIAEGGVRETVVDGVTGLVAEPRPAAVAAALHRLFSDPDLHARLRRDARRDAESKWSLDAATDRLEAKMQELVRGHDAAA